MHHQGCGPKIKQKKQTFRKKYTYYVKVSAVDVLNLQNVDFVM
jgi:hypothetical protein